MANDKPPTAETQPNGQKFSNVINLKLNGPATTVALGCNFHSHSVELPADKDAVHKLTMDKPPADNGAAMELDGLPDRHWSTKLNIIPGKDLSAFTRVGQWISSPHVVTGNHLSDLLDEYKVAMIGGKACVIRWKKDQLPDGSSRDALDMISSQSFRTYHSDKLVEVKDKSGTRLEPVTGEFFRRAKRCDGMVYLPHKDTKVGGAMNLWRGFGVEPKPGDWRRMQDHVYEVLTSCNAEQAIYLMRWCAWTVQNPGLAAEVANVFREGEGAGKGVFVQMLLKIFGIHGLHISNREHLVGNFNKHLMHTSLLYADEAFWAGDVKAEGQLKRLITEPTLTIEPKGFELLPDAQLPARHHGEQRRLGRPCRDGRSPLCRDGRQSSADWRQNGVLRQVVD